VWGGCVWSSVARRAAGNFVVVADTVPVKFLEGSEAHPHIIADNGGDLAVAWKPANTSTTRLKGGLPSQLEAWAEGAYGDAERGRVAVFPALGRPIGGLLFLSRVPEALKAASAALVSGEAEVSFTAVVAGEPNEETIAKAREAEGLDIRVIEASEGLQMGRLALLEIRLRRGTAFGVKVLRLALRHLGHPVVGSGNACAKSQGITGTYLAVTRLAHGDVGAEVEPPPRFRTLMLKDHLHLLRKGGSEGWSGRTEHVEGVVRFDGMSLMVPPGVFVPRESGFKIIEAAFDLPLPPAARILDAGTGSGALLCSMLSRLPAASGIGIDADPAAVAAASANAQAVGIGDRSEVRLGKFAELGELIDEGKAGFDIVISNPPYLPTKVVRQLMFARELTTQSIDAFVSGADGMQAYEELAEVVTQPGFLTPGAWVLMGCQNGAADVAAQAFLATGRFILHTTTLRAAVLRLL